MNKALCSFIAFICMIAQCEILTWVVLGITGLYAAVKLVEAMEKY